MIWLFTLIAVWLLIAVVGDCYDLRGAGNRGEIAVRVTCATLGAGFFYIVLFFIFGRPLAITNLWADPDVSLFAINSPPRLIPALLLLIGLPLVIGWRLAYQQLFTSAPLRRRAIVLGAGRSGQALIRDLQSRLKDYQFLGFIDDDLAKHGQVIQGLKVLGNRDYLTVLAETKAADEVIVAISGEIPNDLFPVLLYCYERGIKIVPMSAIYEEVLGLVPVEYLDPQWFLGPSNTSFPTLYRATKRLVDIGVGLVGLLVFLLIFPFIALAIYISIVLGRSSIGRSVSALVGSCFGSTSSAP